MTPSNTLEEKAAFDRFSDLMAKLMVKHGPSVLRRRKERLIEAIRSSVDISPGIPPEEVSRRLNAYHNIPLQKTVRKKRNTHCVTAYDVV